MCVDFFISLNYSLLSTAAAESEEEEEEEGERGKNVGVARKPTKFKVNEKGETPLHVAAQKGDVKAVRRLLAQAGYYIQSTYFRKSRCHGNEGKIKISV